MTTGRARVDKLQQAVREGAARVGDLEPPPELSAAERALWIDACAAAPHLRRADRPLLESYVHALTEIAQHERGKGSAAALGRARAERDNLRKRLRLQPRADVNAATSRSINASREAVRAMLATLAADDSGLLARPEGWVDGGRRSSS